MGVSLKLILGPEEVAATLAMEEIQGEEKHSEEEAVTKALGVR